MSRSSLAPRPPKHLGLRATLAAILGTTVAYATGCDGPTCIASAGLAAVTTRIALIDLKLRIICDRDILSILTIGLIWNFWLSMDPRSDISLSILRGGLYSAFFQAIRILYVRIRQREGIGFGDVKIAAIAGPLIGPNYFFLALCAASLSGIAFSHFRDRYYHRARSRYSYIPFGAMFISHIYLAWLIDDVVFGDVIALQP